MSNNLGLDQVAENQAAKEVTINTATGQLDAALTESFSADFTPNTNLALTETQFRRCVRVRVLNLTAADRDLTLPAVRKLVIVSSDGANTKVCTVKHGSFSLAINPGENIIVYCTGTAATLVTRYSSTSAKPYDVATYCAGKPDSSEVLLRFNYPRAVTLPAALARSRITAAVAATATTDFVLSKNGATIATIRFAAAGTIATVVGMGSDVSFAVNDQLSITAPGTQDGTLADIAFTFAGVQ